MLYVDKYNRLTKVLSDVIHMIGKLHRQVFGHD